MRLILALVLALALPAVAAAAAQPRTVKPDRAAINRLLDEFIPAAVAQKNLQRGWELSAGAARTVSHSQWLKGNTSVQKYPAKGTSFHGWTVSYSYPGDIGFDILLQPTKASLGAWSFRAEAQKLHGQWRITTWYPVATFAPAGKTETVLGPNDLGPGNASAASARTDHGRLGAWVLALPIAVVGGIGLLAVSITGWRALKRRSRIKEIERSLGR
jgi:opacity protein-like surface antigen